LTNDNEDSDYWHQNIASIKWANIKMSQWMVLFPFYCEVIDFTEIQCLLDLHLMGEALYKLIARARLHASNPIPTPSYSWVELPV